VLLGEQVMGDRRQMTEVRRQKTERPGTEDGRQMTEGGGQRIEEFMLGGREAGRLEYI